MLKRGGPTAKLSFNIDMLPKKRVGLMGYGLEIVDNVPIEIAPNPYNEKYLMTKRDKLGHTILKKK